MAGIEPYMAQYDHEHTNPWNKMLHGIGIPIIFASLVLFALLRWQIGIALFVLGWACLLIGHRIEGNKPAFLQGPVYFLVGPIWVLKEVWDSLSGRSGRAAAPR